MFVRVVKSPPVVELPESDQTTVWAPICPHIKCVKPFFRWTRTKSGEIFGFGAGLYTSRNVIILYHKIMFGSGLYNNFIHWNGPLEEKWIPRMLLNLEGGHRHPGSFTYLNYPTVRESFYTVLNKNNALRSKQSLVAVS